MCPEFVFLGRTFHSYGVMTALGMIMSLLFLCFYYRKNKQDLDDALYIYVLGGLGAFVGAKLLYLLTVLPDFINDLPFMFENFKAFSAAYLQGGFVFYGGLLGGVAAAYCASKWYKRDLMYFAGGLLPSVAIFAGCGRLGCFLAGCCYGRETSLPIGVIFPEGSFAPSGVPLMPVQLIEAVFDFLLALLLWRLASKKVSGPHLLLTYMGSYSIMRFCLEFFRGDELRGVLLGLSTSQWISIFIVIACIAVFLIWRPKNRSCR